MRTIRTKVYKFNELSNEAQEKAIEKLFDINIDHEWWESIYEDAENIGLKLTTFDLDRNRHCEGEFIYSAPETAELILKQHGKDCDTYKTADLFLEDHDKLVEKYSDGINTDMVAENKEDEYDTKADEQEEEFLKSLLEDYSIMLQKEYEYLTGKEAITETILANEYEFTQDGRMI